MCDSKKQCSQCGEFKDINMFTNYRDNHGVLKKRSYCNICRNKWRKDLAERKPVEHKTKQMAYNLINRLTKYIDKPENKCYKDNNIKCKIGRTPIEVYNYIINNFYDDIKIIIDKGEIPSIDRIDSMKDYEEGNIRIITFAENSRLGREQSLKVWQRSVRITYKDGHVEEYEGIKLAGEKSGISRHILHKLLAGKTKPKSDFFVEYIH